MKINKILEKQSIELKTPDAFELSDRLTGRKGIVRANAVTTTLVRVIYNDKIHNDTSIKDMVSKENETINEGSKLNKKIIVSLNEFKKYTESIITNVNSENIVSLIKNELLLHKDDSYYDNIENDENFNIIWNEFEYICNPTEHEVDTIVYGLDNDGIKATTEELYEWMLNKLASCGINESTNDPRTEDKFKSDLFSFLDYPWNKHIETSIVEELNKNRETYVTANENTLKSMLKSLFAKHNKNIMKEGSDLFKYNVKKLTENFNK